MLRFIKRYRLAVTGDNYVNNSGYCVEISIVSNGRCLFRLSVIITRQRDYKKCILRYKHGYDYSDEQVL